MIPYRFQFYTFSFFMSLMMSGIMSLVILSLELPTITEFVMQWPLAWGISMLVAFPVSMIVVPVTQKLVSNIVQSP